MHTWLPYHNYAFLVKLRGSGLWKLLELGATALDNSAKKWGQFLQVSSKFSKIHPQFAPNDRGIIDHNRLLHTPN